MKDIKTYQLKKGNEGTKFRERKKISNKKIIFLEIEAESMKQIKALNVFKKK